MYMSCASVNFRHDGVIKWWHFPRHWTFVRVIYRSPVIFPHRGQWHGALMFSLICAWINGWVDNQEAGDLRRHCVNYDVTVIYIYSETNNYRFFIWKTTWQKTNDIKIKRNAASIGLSLRWYIVGKVILCIYELSRGYTMLPLYHLYFMIMTNCTRV